MPAHAGVYFHVPPLSTAHIVTMQAREASSLQEKFPPMDLRPKAEFERKRVFILLIKASIVTGGGKAIYKTSSALPCVRRIRQRR
jgi:hypothetical protein